MSVAVTLSLLWGWLTMQVLFGQPALAPALAIFHIYGEKVLASTR